jgi:hypothetical protein
LIINKLFTNTDFKLNRKRLIIASKIIKRDDIIRYNLNFRSLIRPTSHVNTQDMSLLESVGTQKPSGKKLLVKQSYLLLTWIFFIAQSTKPKKKSPSGEWVSQKPRFFVKPLRKSKFTITKAPMAHKTFSQEQYGFRIYSINVSFSIAVTNTSEGSIRGLSYNGALFMLMLLRSEPFFFETNLFMLQRISIRLPSADRQLLTIF